MISHVLVVDDDLLFNRMAKVLLKHHGIAEEPRIYLDGRSALSDLESMTTPGHRFLIFLDINMAPVSGWDVLDRLRVHPLSAHMRVVMVTSSIDSADRKKALSYPTVVGYLVKPLTRADLEEVKRIFQRQL